MDFSIAPDNINPAPRGYTFSNLGITGSSVTVQFFQSSEPWVMVGEVSFNSGIPEPASWVMLLLGFAGLGVAGYRRAQKSAAVAA